MQCRSRVSPSSAQIRVPRPGTVYKNREKGDISVMAGRGSVSRWTISIFSLLFLLVTDTVDATTPQTGCTTVAEHFQALGYGKSAVSEQVSKGKSKFACPAPIINAGRPLYLSDKPSINLGDRTEGRNA